MTNKIKTPVGVAHYPYISKPDTQAVEKGYSEKPMYKVNLSISAEEAKPIIESINTVLLAGMKDEKAKTPKKKIKQAPLPYSNEMDEDDTETGNVIFKFKSKYKPQVFDAKNVELFEHNIWGGSELRVGGVIHFYNFPAVGCGVTLRLGAVQLIQYVEGSSGADSFGFEEVEGFSANEDATASTDTQEDVQLNIVETPAETKPKAVAKPKAVPKQVPVEEPAPATAVSSQDELASEIAKLVGDVTDD